jgi:hypothetical protein
MSGNDKCPPLVIGRYANPRAFKNAALPVKYTSNTKAWMTGTIFSDWLKFWDNKLKVEGRKIVLFLDNFSGHNTTVILKQITLMYLPPNTTSRSQVLCIILKVSLIILSRWMPESSNPLKCSTEIFYFERGYKRLRMVLNIK